MKNPHLSIILEIDDDCLHLPLTLIDLDNHLSKLKLPYEILLSSKAEGKTEKAKELVNRFSKLMKNATLKHLSERVKADHVRGEACLALRNNFVPEFESFRNLIESLNTKHNSDGYELVFGAHSNAPMKDTWVNKIGRLLGSPINLRFHHPVIAFSKHVAPSILSLDKHNDIQLSMLADKQGYIVGQLPVRYRSGEEVIVSLKNNLSLIWELIKVKIFGVQPALQPQEVTNE